MSTPSGQKNLAIQENLTLLVAYPWFQG